MFDSHTPRATKPQAEVVAVFDLRTKEQFIAAANCRLKDANAKFAIALALHFNCKTGQCNPGYNTLAAGIRISVRHAKRVAATLDADGWLSRKRGGSDENAAFSLFIPPENTDLIGDTNMSPMEMPLPAPAELPYVTFSPSIGDITVSPLMEQRNREVRGGPSAPRSEYVDRVDVTEELPADPGERAFGAPEEEISPRDQHWYILTGGFPRPPKNNAEEEACKAVFNEIVDRGVDPETIIDAAECIEFYEDPERLPLIDWLKKERWKNSKGRPT